MEFNEETKLENSIIDYQDKSIKLIHCLLNAPCFISKTYTKTLSSIILNQINKTFIAPLLIKDKVSILLIGTGNSQQFLAPKQQIDLHSLNISVELMNQQSAIGCYNLLLSDYRPVGILLL